MPVIHDEEDSDAIAISFAVLDEIPQFEACNESAHINKNLKYPEEAKLLMLSMLSLFCSDYKLVTELEVRLKVKYSISFYFG